MVKHLFFDLDDTLWDFEANAYNALQVLYEQYDLSRFFTSFSHFHSLYMPYNHQLWQRYGAGEISKAYLSKERFEYPLRQVNAANPQLAASLSENFLQFTIDSNLLIPNAIEVVSELHQKYTLSIVSNGFSEVQYKKLEKSGLAPFFEYIILSEHAGALKPDKQFFDYALEQTGAIPREIILIGDNFDADILGALNAGIKPIFFNPNSKCITQSLNDSFDLIQVRSLIQLLQIL